MLRAYSLERRSHNGIVSITQHSNAELVSVTTGGAAPGDTPNGPEALQHLTTPASAPSAVGSKRVERDVVPVGAADTTEGQGETAADSEDEMCVTSATLKRPLDDSGELHGASSTNSQEPPAKAPQGRRLSEKVRAGPANFKGEGALPVTDEASEAALVRDEKSKAPAAGGKKEAEEAMDISKEGAATNKRPHEGVEGEGSSMDLIGAGEPPPKAAPQRRATLRPRPTIPQDRRLTVSTPSTPPPPPPVT
ncbi:hypothetical protein HPB52_023710 [Rhipicephalus sanguineus]|uniref:Uncharacterized protein n=1 Tax=Rhipicephalus sanguineus TaxID=34632 RepID=A0A9D4TC63_RHISA|nr:hypothetical protein HPB52_023710 [Rhipicephalus sanguineus]